jgi:uncharacterized protein YndB with AHSA1/START domain
MHHYMTAITIDAPASKVWDAITQPDLMKQYLNDTDAISDWQTGSNARWRHEWEGKSYEDKGIVLEADPHKLLKLSYLPALGELPDLPENYQQITVYLEETNGSTRFSIQIENIRDDFFSKHVAEFWGEILHNMKQVIETQ